MPDKSARLDVLLTPRDKAALAELAKRDGVSMGTVIRQLIADATGTLTTTTC